MIQLWAADLPVSQTALNNRTVTNTNPAKYILQDRQKCDNCNNIQIISYLKFSSTTSMLSAKLLSSLQDRDALWLELLVSYYNKTGLLILYPSENSQ